MPGEILLGLPLAEPTVNSQTCRVCGLCVETCPADVLCVKDGKIVQSDHSKFGCVGCGHCMAICPTESITVSGRGIGAEDRLRLPPVEMRATADQLEALLVARRATRHFKPDPVPRPLLERVIRTASTAPMGIPPSNVELLVLDSPEKVQAFAEQLVATFPRLVRFLKFYLLIAGPFLGRATKETLRGFILPLLETTWRQRREGRDVLMWNAPAAIIFHHGPYAESADGIIAATYAMIAAHSLGLGTCPIGTIPPTLDRSRSLKRAYGIPEKNRCALALILGFGERRFARAIRRRFASVRYA